MNAGCVPTPQLNAETSLARNSSVTAWMFYRFGLVLGGLAWICVASTLCGCNAVSGWTMNQSGLGYYKKGNYTAARYEFERALMDQPYNASYAYNVAKAMQKQGDSVQAEQMYQQALTLDPQHQPAYHALTEMLIEQGRQDDAQQLLQAWAETQPYDPYAHVELAQLQRRSGNLIGAEQQLQTALRMNPHSPQALDAMGQLQQQMGRPAMAAGYYQRSLAQNPYQPQVSSRLDALSTSGRPDGAIQLANHLQHTDPTLAGGPIQAHYSGPQMSAVPMGPSPMMSSVPLPVAGPYNVYRPAPPGAPLPMAAPRMAPPMQSMPIPQQAAPAISQPIELGQPVPITQVYPQMGAPMLGNAIPTIQAF